MDPLAGERPNAAFGGQHASADSAPDHASFDRLLEPFPVQGPSDADYPKTKPESPAARSFLAGVREQLTALTRLVRRTTGHISDGTNRAFTQLESAPAGQQQKLIYLTVLAAGLTGIWGWRASRSLERVVARRYLDITYQIRRPDALSARITAFKVLVLGGLVLPGSAVTVASWQSFVRTPLLSKSEQETQGTCETAFLPSNPPLSQRTPLAEMLPLPLQMEMRRLVASFHYGLSTFVEAVAPSKQKWEQWASGMRMSQISSLQRPSAVNGHDAIWDRVNSRSSE